MDAAVRVTSDRAVEARAARHEVERGLDAIGWRWSPMLFAWIDALLVLEEHGDS